MVQLYLHRTISSTQLARLCFAEVSYETARKRLRKLQQGGLFGHASSERMEGRGRPELIYFLSAAGAKALGDERKINWQDIPTGVPHTYHKEHLLQLVDVRLALEDAQKKQLIADLEWNTGREFWKPANPLLQELPEQPDATISFRYPGTDPITVLLEIDTGNLRQTRHWEPKIKSFIKTGLPIWVFSSSEGRIGTLRKWTEPILASYGVGPGKCVFAVFDEILDKGIFASTWWRTDGSITDLKPKVQ